MRGLTISIQYHSCRKHYTRINNKYIPEQMYSTSMTINSECQKISLATKTLAPAIPLINAKKTLTLTEIVGHRAQ